MAQQSTPQQPPLRGGQKAAKSPAEILKQRAYVTAGACAVAVVAAGYGVYATVSADAQLDRMQANAVQTVVVATHIAKGEAIQAEDLEVRDVPASLRVETALGPDDLSGEASVIGRLAVTDMAPGTQLTAALAAGEGNTASLADALASGMEAVSIAINDESGMGDNLVVGDVVRVVSMLGSVGGDGSAVDIAPSARVVALDTALTGSGEGYTTVTVEVTPKQAALIRGAQASSGVSLILTAAADGGL